MMLALPVAVELVNAAHSQLGHARRALYAALDMRAEAPGRQVGEHGTPAGYRRHQRAGTVPCFACVEGKGWDDRRRDMKARARVDEVA